MIFGSVCSGIEAASQAWNPLGWAAAWFSEIDPFPAAVLAHRHPETPNLGDMTKLYDSEVFNGAALDVLVGGTPCQSFSVAGLRKGLADPRGNLALHFLKLLDRKRPRWVVWENVPGVLSSWSDEAVVDPPEGFQRDLDAARADADHLIAETYGAAGDARERERARATLGRALADGAFEEAVQSSDFDTFTSGLRELGYNLAWRVLDAQFFGVPQRRRRVFVVGYFGDWRPAAAVLFERHSLSGDPAPRRAAGQGAPGGAQGGAPVCYRWQNEKDGLVEDDVTATLRARAGGTYPRNLPGFVVPPVAFGSKDSGQDALEDQSPTLRAGGHNTSHPNSGVPPAVVYENHAQDSRVKECDVSPQINAKAGTGGGNLPLAIAPAPDAAIPLLEVGKRTGVSTDDPRAGLGVGKEGDPMFTLQAGAQHGVLAPGEEAKIFKPSHFTRGKDGAPSEISPPLSADADKGDQDPVVFESRFARNGRGAPEPVCPPLKAQSGETGKGDSSPLVFTEQSVKGDVSPTFTSSGERGRNAMNHPCVAFTQNSRSEVREIGGDGQITGALAAEPGAQQQNYIASKVVRRLTPRECERLQGFTDDYTLIPWGQHKDDCAVHGNDEDDFDEDDAPCDCGKPPKDAPDGRRYKALGNSMAVPVMAWIGAGIQAVEDLLREAKKK